MGKTRTEGERFSRYRELIGLLLKKDSFKKSKIYESLPGEKTAFIGRVIGELVPTEAELARRIKLILKERKRLEIRMHCPRGHKEMAVKRIKKNVLFRGVRLSIPVEQFVCPECGVEAGTVEQTAAIQKSITNAYRKSVGVLTGKEIF